MIKNSSIDLINSEHIHAAAHVTDHLEDKIWLNAFSERWTLPKRWPVDELKRLRELRVLLRDIVEHLTATREVSDRSVAKLNRFMRPAKSRSVLIVNEKDGFDLETKHLTTIAVSSEIAHAFATLLVECDWRRLKVCANEHCRWAFYDESRNRSRRWCDSTACGNMMKVRAFRERQTV